MIPFRVYYTGSGGCCMAALFFSSSSFFFHRQRYLEIIVIVRTINTQNDIIYRGQDRSKVTTTDYVTLKLSASPHSAGIRKRILIRLSRFRLDFFLD